MTGQRFSVWMLGIVLIASSACQPQSTVPTNTPLTPVLTAATRETTPIPSTVQADIVVDWRAAVVSGPTDYGINGWWTDEDADLWRARYAQLAPKVVRVIAHQTVLEPVNDNDDPNVINWKGFHFNDPFPIPASYGLCMDCQYLSEARWHKWLR